MRIRLQFKLKWRYNYIPSISLGSLQQNLKMRKWGEICLQCEICQIYLADKFKLKKIALIYNLRRHLFLSCGKKKMACYSPSNWGIFALNPTKYSVLYDNRCWLEQKEMSTGRPEKWSKFSPHSFSSHLLQCNTTFTVKERLYLIHHRAC